MKRSDETTEISRSPCRVAIGSEGNVTSSWFACIASIATSSWPPFVPIFQRVCPHLDGLFAPHVQVVLILVTHPLGKSPRYHPPLDAQKSRRPKPPAIQTRAWPLSNAYEVSCRVRA